MNPPPTFPVPLVYPPGTVPRHLVWERARAYNLPIAEYARVGGAEGLRMARNHRDTRTAMKRSLAVRILGELELDRRHPAWGEHRAALADVQDSRLQAEYLPAAGTVAEAHRLHDAAVMYHGSAILRELGL